MTALMWIVWAVIGLCGGYMVSRLVLGGRLGLLLPIIGIVGGILGGWALTLAFGIVEKVLVFSLLTALGGALVVLWFVWRIARAGKQKERDAREARDGSKSAELPE